MTLLFCSDGLAPDRAPSDLPGDRPRSVLGAYFFEDELLMIVIALWFAIGFGALRAESGLQPAPVGNPSFSPS